MRKFKHSFLLLLVGGLFGCELTFEEQFDKELEKIDAFISDNNIAAEVDEESGLRYVIHTHGPGDLPKITDNITVSYEGRLLKNEKVFDSNDEIAFDLNRLILGWQIGFQLLPEGSTATLFIPSAYGYGSQGSGTIPGNASLIFDVELKKIN